MLRVKRHTFKIMLATSLLWLVVDLAMLLLYRECEGEECASNSSSSSSRSSTIGQEEQTTESSRWAGYPSSQLQEWTARAAVTAGSPDLPGEQGQAVRTPPGREKEKAEKFKVNQFNLLVSELISVNRSLGDVRLAECRGRQYPALLPTTSIVIVFHNEALSTLLRTLHSIINRCLLLLLIFLMPPVSRSPLALVQEILLVDDASTQPHLGLQLEQEVAKLPLPVKLLRTGTRSGLIRWAPVLVEVPVSASGPRARLLGAGQAQGQVLTFLDSHVEATEGWLEPLLSEVGSY